MRLPDLWFAPQWMTPALILGGIALAVLLWAYARTHAPLWVRCGAATLKAGGIALLVVCLLEPMHSDERPKPMANLFVIVADESQSLQIKDPGEAETRGELIKRQLVDEVAWQDRLSQDFDVRRYTFSRRLRAVEDFSDYSAEGTSSSVIHSLDAIGRRYQGRPIAGILLLSDGNATDDVAQATDWKSLPPVYPAVVGSDDVPNDIRVVRTWSTQSNFEVAPVTISAEMICHGYAGQTITAVLLDESDKELQRQQVSEIEDDRPFVLRFQVQPEKRGVIAYRLRTFAKSEESQEDSPAASSEATLLNNSRMIMVDRGQGPYRVLYVTGRPNWELKFLRRAAAEDDEVDLVALVRIARREPKFTFRGRAGETTNPLYRGFSNQQDEQAEQYDEPVLLRLGVKDTEGEELRDGFPKSVDQLFRYHAIVLDDVEAGFFSEDQKTLIKEFVSRRGGGLLMLGGQESFAQGDYDRTPIGEVLPVYLDRPESTPARPVGFELTRDGWLQPWVRVRSTQQEERQRLQAMPKFKTINRVRSIKPGAMLLAQTQSDGTKYPLLAVQKFGKGRAAALLVGDMWRWQLNRKTSGEDLMAMWRQTIRWLVADVPQRVDASIRRQQQLPEAPVQVVTRVRDETYQPLDNVALSLDVIKPDGSKVQLSPSANEARSGVYTADFLSRETGAYRASVIATSAEGEEIGRQEVGWVAEPAAEEFASLKPNRALLEQIAVRTGGEMIQPDELDEFVASLPNRKIPITETHIYPWWHAWTVFLLAVGLLVGEWGLRRWYGLP